MITDLLIIRHGEAYNTAPHDGQRTVSDPANPPLTPLGERQAEELRSVLAEFAPDTIVVSPFLRAVQTVFPYLAAAAATPVRVEWRFGEIMTNPVFRQFRGIDLSDYRGRFSGRIPFPPALSGRAVFPEYPESPESVRNRVAALWRELDGPGGAPARIACVGHGASLGALLTQLVPECAAETGHVNCGATHLRRGPSAWRPLFINRADHLTQYGPAAALIARR